MKGHNTAKGLYKSAIDGAYFGLLNILFIFVPLANSLFMQKGMFSFYVVVGIFCLILNLSIIIRFKRIYNYEYFSIRYLYFSGTFLTVLCSGILYRNILIFGSSFSNIYLFFLQFVLIIMSAFDILVSAHNGMIRMKTMYLRTINFQYFKNALTILSGAALGILLLIPYYVQDVIL